MARQDASGTVELPERFVGVLTEHFAGRFPLWLAPEQVRLLPLNEDVFDYVHDLADTLEGVDLCR